MGKCKELSSFNKGQFVMARLLGQSICTSAGLFPSMQCVVPTQSGLWKYTQLTRNMVMGRCGGGKGSDLASGHKKYMYTRFFLRGCHSNLLRLKRD